MTVNEVLPEHIDHVKARFCLTNEAHPKGARRAGSFYGTDSVREEAFSASGTLPRYISSVP